MEVYLLLCSILANIAYHHGKTMMIVLVSIIFLNSYQIQIKQNN
jgi:hypothetical protein